LALGLMPLLVAFPFVVGVLGVVGGERANELLVSNLRAQLSSSHNYLEQLKADTRVRVSQLVKSEGLAQLIRSGADKYALNALLNTTAQSSGFDFLLVADAEGNVLGSSTGVGSNRRLPNSFVIRQAIIGVANAAFERFDANQLAAFSPQFGAMAQVSKKPATSQAEAPETRGLLINAGAHFPLAINNPDVILLGGILINRNFALIEHMREIVFPIGSLMNDIEGVSAIYVDGTSVNVSRQRLKGQSEAGTMAPAKITQEVMELGQLWFGRTQFGQESHLAGFEAILNGEGQRIGMLSVAFPDSPYRQSMWTMLAMVAALLALTMLAISFLFVRAARTLTGRLETMGNTMVAIGQGDRTARMVSAKTQDELAQLGEHFNVLLDRIAAQDERQRAAQQTIADEATRRRALFENERDGVAILNPDGTVFEVNPKCAAMLGYSVQELQSMHASRWDAFAPPTKIQQSLAQIGAEGLFFETVQRRKDGSTYPAEVSLSRADWGDKSFVFMLQRDITDRKATEAELALHRLELEKRVEERTHELNERSEQLNTIFKLSPDGFVSFDPQLKVSFANHAFQRMTGLDIHDIMGLDEQAFSDKLVALSTQGAVFQGMNRLRSARLKVTEADDSGAHNGNRRQLFELSKPVNRVLEVGIRMSDAQSVSHILYLRDVTHEIEVERLKSEFLSTAAHELRTPMTTILGYSELLLMQEFEVAERHEFLTTVHRQSQLMASVINELLDLARIEARRGKDFHLENASLQEVVAQTLADFRPTDGRKPPIITCAAADLPVKIDCKKMQQVVLNIVSNAYKYSPQGGEVAVHLYAEQVDGQSRACFEIKDPGIGMNVEELSRVCERFYRADTSGKILGTGLGMSIVKEIVELLHGDMTLQSTPGQGTTVKVCVPLV
jgi:PAS domain S-box-containing protein